jgi:signal transduction histidine kinase
MKPYKKLPLFKLKFDNQAVLLHKDNYAEAIADKAGARYCHEKILPTNYKLLIKKAIAGGSPVESEDTEIAGRSYSFIFIPAFDNKSVDAYAIDVTKRKNTEDELRKSQELFYTVLLSLPVAVFSVDSKGIFILSEGLGLEILDIFPEKTMGKHIDKILKDKQEILSQVKRALKGERSRQNHVIGEKTVNLLCSPIISEAGNIGGAVSICLDVTDQENKRFEIETYKDFLEKQARQLEDSLSRVKESQAMLMQSEKLASLGTLASSIMHEINNPLMVILTRAQICAMLAVKNKELSNNLDIIIEKCHNLKNTTARLLQFSKPSREISTRVDVNRCVKSSIAVFKDAGGLKNIETEENYSEDQPFIVADEKHLQEALVNIFNNAAEAMPAGGVLRIRTIAEPDFVIISVEDTGKGMSSADLKRVFEPFFTTKLNGTGLGLSIVKAIVNEYKGHVKAESRPDKGTIFTFMFPKVKTC